MLTLALQCLTAVLGCCFARAALSISRHRTALAPDRRAGWLLAAVGFGVFGASSAVQDVGAVAAFLLGEGTAVYDTYLRWAPAMNHSRIGAGIAFGGAMAWVAWRGRFPGRLGWAVMLAAMLVGMLAGAAGGAREGPFEMRVHGFTAATGLTVELIAFATALLVAASRGTLDLFLWTALMFYASSMALSVPLLSSASLADSVGHRRPAAWLLQLQPAVLGAMMLGVALFRLALLQRGLRVRDVLGRGPGRRPRVLDLDRAGDAPAGVLRER
ncbi:MAG TPA: hypothetical protein VHG51_18195 [Longimicrobiaceae bacterium]|nr:hypothetical protein [Longimicrobiaceae bacterium]